MKAKFVFLTPFLLLFFLFQNADACSCVMRETCQFFSGAQVVFVGKIIDSTERDKKVTYTERPIGSREWEKNEYTEKRQISRLLVEENFLGSKENQEILIETEIGSSCGFYLRKDESYLIYANKSEKEENLTTHLCSGTKQVSEAQEDLNYLRANKSSSAIVSGKVGFGKYWQLDPTPLAKFGVATVNLENAERQFQASIEKDGSYNFSDVPKGKYRLRVVLPDTLTTDEDYSPDIAEELGIEDQSAIEVSSHGCFKKNFFVSENGRIGGRITDAEGKPIEEIAVYLIPISKNGQKIDQEEKCYDSGLCLNTDKKGNYFFKGLKAGRYLVGVRLDDYVGNDSADAAYFRTYFPGVPIEEKAVAVIVKSGKPTENIDFKLTRKFPAREIKGRVFFEDGRPASKVKVRYIARTPDFKDNGITFVKTDENGYFSFTGYENHAYLIGAFTDARDGNETAQSFAVVIKILPRKDVKEVKLVLDQKGMDECPKCGDYAKFPNARTVYK